MALLSSGIANALTLHNAAPPTPRHSDVHDQLPPGCVYTADLPFAAQTQTLAPPQSGNQLITPKTAAAQPVIMVNEGVDHYLEEERLRKDEEVSLLAQQVKRLENSIQSM